MEDLIRALQIFSKYTKTKYPTHCEHDVLMICNLEEDVTEEDAKALEGLGFFLSEEYEGWCSFRFGSC
jgi:glutamate dehydrogenase/leucine dehydrogenase